MEKSSQAVENRYRKYFLGISSLRKQITLFVLTHSFCNLSHLLESSGRTPPSSPVCGMPMDWDAGI